MCDVVSMWIAMGLSLNVKCFGVLFLQIRLMLMFMHRLILLSNIYHEIV